ncbi:MAG: hypothetical protein IJ838_02875 [Paludibacteraceae bacterium]|nr:hypothetical protein [Paludibacteraceae bacterium]
MKNKQPYCQPDTGWLELEHALCVDFVIGSGGADPNSGLAPQRRQALDEEIF